MRLVNFAGSLTLAAALFAGVSDAVSGATVVDRTYRCLVPPVYDEVRQINVSAGPRSEATAAGAAARPASVFIGARRGGYGERHFFGISFGPGDQRETGSITVDPKLCRQVTDTKLALVSRGLPGPPVAFGQYVACPATRAVLVRLRAVVDRTPGWRRQGGYLTAKVNVLEAKVAVRTLIQAPIAFVAVSHTGASQTYFSPRCD